MERSEEDDRVCQGHPQNGDDAAAEYLVKSSREQLRARPRSSKQADEVDLVKTVQRLQPGGRPWCGLDLRSATSGYVTEQALEQALRDDRQAGSIAEPRRLPPPLRQKVFGGR